MSANPQTPVYAKDRPSESCACGCNGNEFYHLPVDPNSRVVEVVTSNPQLSVNDQSDSGKWKFVLDFIPHEALAGTLSLTPYASAVAKPNPCLKGETIDRVDLAWTWNNEVTSQELDSDNGAISHPTLSTAARSHSYTGLSLTTNTQFTLDGDDGKGLTGSELQKAINLQFGNYYYYGHGASKLNQATSGLQSFLGGLTKDIATSKGKTLYATGGAGNHFFFAFPKSFGLPASITKGLLDGGYIRLKNLSGTLVADVGAGSESDISISNGLASEAYYVFMSFFDNQADAVNPIVVA